MIITATFKYSLLFFTNYKSTCFLLDLVLGKNFLLRKHKNFFRGQLLNFILLNPCEHRAKILAQAYLKPSKKGRKNES
jgi:hypothetical protein